MTIAKQRGNGFSSCATPSVCAQPQLEESECWKVRTMRPGHWPQNLHQLAGVCRPGAALVMPAGSANDAHNSPWSAWLRGLRYRSCIAAVMEEEHLVRRQRLVGNVGLADQRRRGPRARDTGLRSGPRDPSASHSNSVPGWPNRAYAVALGVCIPGHGKPRGRRQDRGNCRLRNSMSHDRLLN